MIITRKGEPLEIPGTQPKIGSKTPDFILKDLEDLEFSLSSFNGKPTILSIVPDIDTRVCAIQTKKFNQQASQMDQIHFATISNNTKEEQANWCGQEGVEMTMLHDPENTFGEAFQIMIPTLGLYARSIFVLDQQGILRYSEIVPEMSQEPDYLKALEIAQNLV